MSVDYSTGIKWGICIPYTEPLDKLEAALTEFFGVAHAPYYFDWDEPQYLAHKKRGLDLEPAGDSMNSEESLLVSELGDKGLAHSNKYGEGYGHVVNLSHRTHSPVPALDELVAVLAKHGVDVEPQGWIYHSDVY